MKLSKAITILEYHQRWRLGELEEMKYTPKELTEAIEVLLKEVKKNKAQHNNDTKRI